MKSPSTNANVYVCVDVILSPFKTFCYHMLLKFLLNGQVITKLPSPLTLNFN